jgi:hypothetical protein
MNPFRPTHIAAALLIAAVLCLIEFACTAPHRLTGEIEFFGIRASFTYDSQGQPTINFTGSLPQGKCLQVAYRGADGALLGTATVHVPGSSQVPAGTTSESYDLVDCPPPGHAPNSGGAGAHSVHTAADEWIDICGFPLMPDLVDGGIYKNAFYHFRVKAISGIDPFTRIEPILRGGPGTAVPPDVEVVSFTQFIPDTTGGRMLVGDTEAFDQFRLDWNGQVGYADLATGTNAVQYTVGSEWHVVESFIPLQDFHVLVGETNHGLTHRKTVSDANPSDIDASLTVLEF